MVCICKIRTQEKFSLFHVHQTTCIWFVNTKMRFQGALKPAMRIIYTRMIRAAFQQRKVVDALTVTYCQ